MCFGSLVPTYKWTCKERNIEIGYIVLIQYSSKSKSGMYRWGRVILVEVDHDQLVRTCTVQYRLFKDYGSPAYTKPETKFIRVAV